MKAVYLRFKNDLRSEGITLSDFSSLTPFAVSMLELGLPSGCDLVMEGPFQEPDNFLSEDREKRLFLNRFDVLLDIFNHRILINIANIVINDLCCVMSKEYKLPGMTLIKDGLIGAGGSGQVFKCHEKSSNAPYALKILNSSDSKKKDRFLREVFIHKDERLRGSVVPCLCDGEVDNTFCYVMPIYQCTLRDLIKRNTASMLERISWFIDICKDLQAIRCVHKEFVHRDLKPENILFDGEHLLIGDCGIAHLYVDYSITTKGDLLANRDYCSPEQRHKRSKPDHAMDVYALGLILNEIFTGSIPLGQKFRRIGDIYPPFSFLDNLVDSMMMQDPADRRDIDAVIITLQFNLRDFKSRFDDWISNNPRPDELSDKNYGRIIETSYEDLILAEKLINNPDTNWMYINRDFHCNIRYNAQRFFDFILLMRIYDIVVHKSNYEGTQRFLGNTYHEPPSGNEDPLPYYSAFDDLLRSIGDEDRPFFASLSMQEIKGICEKQFRSLIDYHLKEVFWPMR